jgi:hypothetical protein
MNRAILLTLAASVSSDAAIGGDQDKDTAYMCCDGYVQYRAAIKTLSCALTMRISPVESVNPYTGKKGIRPAEVQRLTWWQDGATARCTVRYETDDVMEEYLWKDGVFKHLKTVRPDGAAGGPATHVGRLDGPNGLNGVPSAWLPSLWDPPERLRKKLDTGTIVAAEAERAKNGDPCYKVTLDADNYREILWFDVNRNYMIQKNRFHSRRDDPTSYHEGEIVNCKEFRPGIFFPVNVAFAQIYQNKQIHSSSAEYHDVKINEPADRSKLQLQYPSGTRVTDVRSGMAYTVGENEQPTDTPKPTGKPADLSGQILYPTGMEKRSYTAWYIAGSVAVVALTAAAIVVRVRRRARGL